MKPQQNSIKDFVKLTFVDMTKNMIKEEIDIEGNTWNATGLNKVAGCVVGAIEMWVDRMSLKGGGNTIYVDLTAGDLTNSMDNSVAIFEGSWSASDVIASASTLCIMHTEGYAYSKVTFSAFGLDDETALIVNWRSTITGDWTLAGKRTIASNLTQEITSNYANSIGIIVSEDAPGELWASASGEITGTTIAQWKSTFDAGGRTLDFFVLTSQADHKTFSVYDITPNLTVPTGVDLAVIWKSTFNAG